MKQSIPILYGNGALLLLKEESNGNNGVTVFDRVCICLYLFGSCSLSLLLTACRCCISFFTVKSTIGSFPVFVLASKWIVSKPCVMIYSCYHMTSRQPCGYKALVLSNKPWTRVRHLRPGNLPSVSHSKPTADVSYRDTPSNIWISFDLNSLESSAISRALWQMLLMFLLSMKSVFPHLLPSLSRSTMLIVLRNF